jgi:oxygen-independent coproporphyrinogen-3 oxidase
MLATRQLRNFLSAPGDDYTFRSLTASCTAIQDNSGLYIHVPFCRQLCPYCPYLKFSYTSDAVESYMATLLAEIQLHKNNHPSPIPITSVYFGGGSPMILGHHLKTIVDSLKEVFNISGDLAIESNPMDISKDSIEGIRAAGFELISIGIQSFSTPLLKNIGRMYEGNQAVQALKTIVNAGFKTVNVDLMFVLPNQTDNDLLRDLETAISCNPTQITCYPLFTFPYTDVTNFSKRQKVIMPNLHKRRRQYYLVYDFLISHGYRRESVWSFSKNCSNNYSSVTRENFVGIGPGSGSYNGANFTFNSFILEDWHKDVSSGKLPQIIGMKISRRMAKLFWVYWSIYTTRLSLSRYQKVFGTEMKRDFYLPLRIMQLLGMINKLDEDTLALTRRGCHWIHLLQNYFALNYVNKIWGVCRATSRPEPISL